MTKSPEIRAREVLGGEQVITDYVKFLADARDAVYRLGCDQATAKQLKNRANARKRTGSCKKGSDRFGEPDYKKAAQ